MSQPISSSSPPSPPPSSSPDVQERNIVDAYTSFKHNAALAFLVGAPVLIALPPRKLDLYTFSLTGAFVASANHICRERTGRGLLSQLGYDYMASARREQASRIESQHVEAGRRLLDVQGPSGATTVGGSTTLNKGEDWKEKRLKEEQEKLDSGEGYGGMIVDQIWDVWNQKKDGEQGESKKG